MKSIFTDDSGQAMTEYIIASSGVVLVMIAFLNTEIPGLFPSGIYKGIFLFLKGMIINVALPIP